MPYFNNDDSFYRNQSVKITHLAILLYWKHFRERSRKNKRQQDN